jgi:hypothetical protein
MQEFFDKTMPVEPAQDAAMAKQAAQVIVLISLAETKPLGLEKGIIPDSY